MSKAMKPHHFAGWVLLFGLVIVVADGLDRLITKPRVCGACLLIIDLKQANRDKLYKQRAAEHHAE